MVIDIWSDIMCPFCYIGKRQLESAIASFDKKEEVKVNWHSYQLNPTIQYQEGKDIYTYLAEMKGQTREWSVKMHQSMLDMAKKEGLEYNFNIAKIANSFHAHRIIQYAKSLGWADQMEERFFYAYFMEGANLSDYSILVKLAVEIGLEEAEVETMLNSHKYYKEVEMDIETARQIGVTGVPFFVFNNKYAISGARGSALFLQFLNQISTEQTF